MKRFISILLAFTLLLVTGIGGAWAQVSLPTLDFGGNAQTTATVGTGTFKLVDASVSGVNYLDETSTTVNGPDESIIGKSVIISGATRTGDYTFTDAVITISDGSFNYFSATLSNIVWVTDGVKWYLNPGLNSTDPSTLNLTNIVLATDVDHPSKFIDDLIQAKGTTDFLGMKIIVDIFSGNFEGTSSSDIFLGLIDGAPEGGGGGTTEPPQPPSGVRTIGYWKNHDPERDAFIGGAVAFSTVFSTAEELNASLAKVGKKTMEEKAKQQLAAILLNISASLDPATVLQSGELEILQLIAPSYDTTATVGDALTEIELVITSDDFTNIENAKDLADEINNRDHNNNS